VTGNPTSIYDALGGDDHLLLPDTTHYSLGGVTWASTHLFSAGGGNDYVAGGSGDDNVDLGEGEDTFFGSLGNDTVSGGGGADTFDYSFLSVLPSGTVETLNGGSQPSDGLYLPLHP